MLQTAERILKENCPDVKANFLGNAPAGFYKYKYPKIVQNQSGVIGAKVIGIIQTEGRGLGFYFVITNL